MRDKMVRSKVDPKVWNDELKREEDKAAYEMSKARTKSDEVKASIHYAKAAKLRDKYEFVTVDEDDLLSVINEPRESDEDLITVDEDDLLNEINRAKRRH